MNNHHCVAGMISAVRNATARKPVVIRKKGRRGRQRQKEQQKRAYPKAKEDRKQRKEKSRREKQRKTLPKMHEFNFCCLRNHISMRTCDKQTCSNVFRYVVVIVCIITPRSECTALLLNHSHSSRSVVVILLAHHIVHVLHEATVQRFFSLFISCYSIN